MVLAMGPSRSRLHLHLHHLPHLVDLAVAMGMVNLHQAIQAGMELQEEEDQEVQGHQVLPTAAKEEIKRIQERAGLQSQACGRHIST